MRSLLPGFKAEKNKLALKNIAGPALPVIPPDLVLARMRELETLNRDLPKLRVVEGSTYAISLVHPDGTVDEENFLNWAALSYLQLSAVGVVFVKGHPTQREIFNRYTGTARTLDRELGGVFAPRNPWPDAPPQVLPDPATTNGPTWFIAGNAFQVNGYTPNEPPPHAWEPEEEEEDAEYPEEEPYLPDPDDEEEEPLP